MDFLIKLLERHLSFTTFLMQLNLITFLNLLSTYSLYFTHTLNHSWLQSSVHFVSHYFGWFKQLMVCHSKRSFVSLSLAISFPLFPPLSLSLFTHSLFILTFIILFPFLSSNYQVSLFHSKLSLHFIATYNFCQLV